MHLSALPHMSGTLPNGHRRTQRALCGQPGNRCVRDMGSRPSKTLARTLLRRSDTRIIVAGRTRVAMGRPPTGWVFDPSRCSSDMARSWIETRAGGEANRPIKAKRADLAAVDIRCPRLGEAKASAALIQVRPGSPEHAPALEQERAQFHFGSVMFRPRIVEDAATFPDSHVEPSVPGSSRRHPGSMPHWAALRRPSPKRLQDETASRRPAIGQSERARRVSGRNFELRGSTRADHSASGFGQEPGAPNGAPPVAWAVVPVGVAAFWGGTWMAARHYPQEYDWRYMTISSLLSAERNPAGHLWASAGVVACGICGYCWAALWIRRTRRYGANDPGFAVRALQFGYACMALAAALPDGLLPIAKGHEVLAILAFAGVSYGMVRIFQRSVVQNMMRPDGHRRLWPACWWPRRAPDLAGRMCTGLCVPRALGPAVGQSHVACPRRAGLYQLCLLGMADLPGAVGVHDDARTAARPERSSRRAGRGTGVPQVLNRRTQSLAKHDGGRTVPVALIAWPITLNEEYSME